MSAINDRVESIREGEEMSGMTHFSQETLDLLREKTDVASLLITGARGGTGSRGGFFNYRKRLAQQLYVQRILVGLTYPSCLSAN